MLILSLDVFFLCSLEGSLEKELAIEEIRDRETQYSK
jgi:hypothetical protein